MSDGNLDGPADLLAELPECVRGGRLVGVDDTGVPVYFDEGDERAFEVLQTDGEWVVGEERADTTLDELVTDVAQVTGWEALSAYGDEATRD